MSNLPHRRPHRRTGRRKAHAPALEGTTARAATGRPRRAAQPPPRPGTPDRGGREPAPGLPELALSATVEAAKIPLGVTASVARRAAGLIGRRSGS